MSEGQSGGPSSSAIVHVKWLSCTAGFTDASVKSIIQKSSEHSGLSAAVQPDLVLLATLEGKEVEVTDDILATLSEHTTLTLSRVERECVTRPAEATGKPEAADATEHVCSENPIEHGLSSKIPSSDVATPVGMFVLTGKRYAIECCDSDTVHDLKARLYNKGTAPPEQQRLVFSGQQLEDGRTVSDYGIQRESVIYLLIPDETLSVTLAPQWTFSHVYPLAAPKRLGGGRQRIDWSVSAQPDGTLVEKDTSLELSYLFWEAESNHSFPPSLPLGAADARAECFDPAYPMLDCDTPTAVLLPFAELLPYLDVVLKRLSLHTAARNDFITYWLPRFADKLFVALRFLPQAAYERAATLDVQPAPEVVTRVFMLFNGVSAEDASHPTWSAARARVGKVDWVKIVGVEARAWDESRFRVLEWGAMEVF